MICVPATVLVTRLMSSKVVVVTRPDGSVELVSRPSRSNTWLVVAGVPLASTVSDVVWPSRSNTRVVVVVPLSGAGSTSDNSSPRPSYE